MKHLGDITKIDGTKAPAVEVVIGGSPCQDLSVAGKRAGLAGERSGLFMEQIRIIKEMRRESERSGATVIIPRYMVWENVPGAFSSNGGEDFRVVLEETARVADASAAIPRPTESWTNAGAVMGSGWSIAWRVLDARFWGVPQRRRRIALVADFGGYTAPEILFERNSLSWNTPQGGATWEEFAEAFAERFGKTNSRKAKGIVAGFNGWKSITGSIQYREELCPTIESNMQPNVVCDLTEVCNISGDDIAGTLDANYYRGVGARNGKEREVVAIDRAAFNQGINAQYDMEISESGINSTLTSRGPSAICAGFKANMGAKAHGIGYESDTAPTLSAIQHDAAVCVSKGCLNPFDCQSKRIYDPYGVAPHIIKRHYRGMNIMPSILNKTTVRRLTPLECERLQGYPDGWTDIGDWIDSKGKQHKLSDSPRYKALGNSIALPPWAWILDRLNYFCALHTMASLFDGIGGFPLIWETLNGVGSCLWASEIEEFPIAVTKQHFRSD